MKGEDRAGIRCLGWRAQIGRGSVILAVVFGLEMMGSHFGTYAGEAHGDGRAAYLYVSAAHGDGACTHFDAGTTDPNVGLACINASDPDRYTGVARIDNRIANYHVFAARDNRHTFHGCADWDTGCNCHQDNPLRVVCSHAYRAPPGYFEE